MNPKLYFFEVEEENIDRIKKVFPEAIIFTERIHDPGIIEKCSDAEIISVFVYSMVTTKILSQMPNLKMIAVRGVGYDKVSLDYLRQHKIQLANVPDYGSHVIAEHVFALLLSAVRRIREADKRIERGIFSYHGLGGMVLKNKTIGIIGTGKIGSIVAKIAYGFDMNILACDVYENQAIKEQYQVKYVSQETLLQQSDIITLHTPLLPTTQHMINRDTIAVMKDGVILINTARGAIIKTSDVIEAIENNKFSYVLLDVLEVEERIISKSKEIQKLVSFPNVITTPHIAFYTEHSMESIYTQTLNSIKQFLNKEKIINQVKLD
jgi:D-lactate dehydrogenase